MFYKIITNGYLVVIGTGNGGEAITREEYENIRSVIKNKPSAQEGYDYLLKADLTWELTEIPIAEEEISGNEFLMMLEEVL